MRDVARVREGMQLRSGERSGYSCDQRSEQRRAVPAGRQEHRLGERGNAAEVEGELLRVVRLVEKSWSVSERCPRQLSCRSILFSADEAELPLPLKRKPLQQII